MAQVYCVNPDCIHNKNGVDCDLIQVDIDEFGQCKNVEEEAALPVVRSIPDASKGGTNG